MFNYSRDNYAFLCFNKMLKHSIYILNKCLVSDTHGFILLLLILLIFAIQEVPDPVKYFITRWSKDPWIQMAYSFVKTGGSGEAYDILAEDIQGKIFFAGEVKSQITFFLKKIQLCSNQNQV